MENKKLSEDSYLDELFEATFVNDFRARNIVYKGVSLPSSYPQFADAIENLKVRDDDVWVCSFPKTGKLFLNYQKIHFSRDVYKCLT